MIETPVAKRLSEIAAALQEARRVGNREVQPLAVLNDAISTLASFMEAFENFETAMTISGETGMHSYARIEWFKVAVGRKRELAKVLGGVV